MKVMTDQRPPTHKRRADWLSVLALAPAQALNQAAAGLLADLSFTWLRRPECGLVMLRARVGNTGDRYNIGEATVTRCALRAKVDADVAHIGVGYVLGRDLCQAQQIAAVDAMLQSASAHQPTWDLVIEPLRARLREQQQADQDAAESTRVKFFTLQPEATR
jgi:alpha-D-ribose 1-methylphosphonate 5-triphosphate synthase subunit PhnG